MLSATVGSLDDVVVGQFDSAPEVASPDFSEEAIGLPSGVSLLVCPVANWSESGSGQLAPTPAIETNQSIEANGSLSGVIDDSGLLLCTFPPASFSLSCQDSGGVGGCQTARWPAAAPVFHASRNAGQRDSWLPSEASRGGGGILSLLLLFSGDAPVTLAPSRHRFVLSFVSALAFAVSLQCR